ncbi:YcxB family protein [Pseudobutyrivibrio xylanivorans]|uniref:YcxB family protein n=1 Tax=Pseudobutyrivibrio xylanivorans TaxID=185007 RepID=A0A5P6VQ43_PSEXY|nr:YcxB family protein [Pseudobutyrivibrio xylanivorans]QFJ54697.1 YcxB family protein [Pseudobutyrivibrio xylanivorans]
MGQSTSFSVKIKEEDLYRFNLHHAYTSSQGIISVVLFILLIAVWILRFPQLSLIYKVLYPVIATVFLLYIPMSLKLRVKTQMQQEVFQYPLTYELVDTGIKVSSPSTEEPAELPWEYVYKISTWKDYLLIYSNRVNAYIIPRKDIKDVYEPIIDYIKNHVEDYKLQIK